MKKESVVQFTKFMIVGGVNTVVDWGVFFILTHYVVTAVGFEPMAKAISFMVSLVGSFIMHSKWTFRDEFKQMVDKKKVVFQSSVVFIKFFAVSLIGWGINYLAFKFTRFNLDQGQLISLVAASGSGLIWNFFANKLWTYKK